jgi:hypothetical protein
MICRSQNIFSELWEEILDSKRWAIYQTEAIENRYSVWNFQDFSEKKNILKIQNICHSAKKWEITGNYFCSF